MSIGYESGMKIRLKTVEFKFPSIRFNFVDKILILDAYVINTIHRSNSYEKGRVEKQSQETPSVPNLLERAITRIRVFKSAPRTSKSCYNIVKERE